MGYCAECGNPPIWTTLEPAPRTWWDRVTDRYPIRKVYVRHDETQGHPFQEKLDPSIEEQMYWNNLSQRMI